MMYIQTRRRKLIFPFSSFLSNSFLFFSFHFPLNLICQTNWKRKKPPHSQDLNSGASSSSTSLYGGDHKGGDEQGKGNNYEVFLSFRGKDTRKGFTDYLYTSLVDAGIHVFRDDNELRVGEEIGPELLHSITQSKISIPIISEDYASSKWCLRELALMLKCKKNRGQIVLPIFYKVEPSQVRNPTGRLRDAINGQKKNLDKIVVKEWEEALEEVSFLKGWESEKIDNGYEGRLVKTVVREVTSELRRTFQPIVPTQFVGIDDRVEDIMSLIDAEFNVTKIIGIYGMGGIGKTTLARVLYNNLSRHFEHLSFLANVRETSIRKGIEYLQKQLINDILRSPYDVSNVYEGIDVIKSRFTSKKALILLDDMDDDTHLKALAGDSSWFKAGSIIIITTRNKTILDKARAGSMYQLNALPSDQSLILFSRHAFRKDSPPSDYEDISRAIISTTGGLPLALEVIGSLLFEKTIKVWKDTLKKLQKVPVREVQETLKISYEALDYGEKQILLDIACFFIGETREDLTYMWDACGFFSGNGIEVLSHMSLIKIDEDGTLMMHDQLRDLGREIVRLENPMEPQERSRLWIEEEAEYVLDSNKGTSKIEALRLNNWGQSYTAKQLKELTNLRFLQLSNAKFTGDFQNLLPQLRWLCWQYCSLNFEAADFHPKKLVVVNLLGTKISKDWGGWGLLKMATELKVLNLSCCHPLTRTPDLSACKSLEILILERCPDLKEIHPSLGEIKTLVSLNVKYCMRLKELPVEIGRMEELRELFLDYTAIREIPIFRGYLMKLETLSASNCELLARLPESMGSLVSLTRLYLSKTGIEELPASIGSLKELETLDVSYCASLTSIPSSIGHLSSLSLLDLSNCHKLAQLPNSIGSLMSLQHLILLGCLSLREIPHSIGRLASLTQLHLDFTAIEELPESIGSLKKLDTLHVTNCALLARIPSSIGHLPSLSLLDLRNCHKLAQLPDSIGSLMSLKYLLLSRCCSLREIPNSIGKLTSLTELNLNSTAIVKLPDSIGNIQNLEILDTSGTCILESDAIRVFEKIQELRTSGCNNLEGSPGELVLLNTVSSLQNIGIGRRKELPSRLLAQVLAKLPWTPRTNNSAMDYPTADSEHVLKRSRPFRISDEVNNLMVNILPFTYNSQSHGQSSYSSDDLPRNLVMTLNQGSPVKSMDFHPVQQLLLLVGTNMGDVMVWEVGSRARIALRNFKVWDLGTCSAMLQASLANDYTASVNHVMWSPDGTLFGVAYSKHMVHIYSYHGGDDIRNHLEIEAHVGSVNDLAFSYPNRQLCVVTCGEDRLIKVWDAVTGAKQHTFEGHEAPVYSICPHHKYNIQFIFTTATDGKIKAWLYDNMGSRVDDDAPGHSSTVMAYSADGTRLFSCGTNKEGESYLVEWNERKGAVKRTYHGLGKRSGGVVQFDTANNRFLAAGDEFTVKFWDMDNKYMLTSTDAEGGLPASPCIRFNKEGILLAVSTSDNSIKILANADGIRLLRIVENRPFDASRVTPGPPVKNSESMADVKPGIADELGDKSRMWKLTEINEPSQCRSIWLPDNIIAMRVSRLTYTNSGLAILALSSNAEHKLWKWQKSDRNLTGKATTSVVPQLWHPPSGILMTNDISDTNPEDAVPCFALSMNDSYLLSSSGGKISLFNMMTFKKVLNSIDRRPTKAILWFSRGLGGRVTSAADVMVELLSPIPKKGDAIETMTTFMPPPPAATFMAFHPQDNNIIAIGMKDSSIQIYNVRVHEVKTKLKGHQKRITGLAFSNILNVLVSSGSDSQLCVWRTDGWEKQASKVLQMPTGRGTAPLADTRVQFHLDQIHLLVVHKTQIAIYEAPKLECLAQCVTREASSPITHATYSCDGQSIYVSFEDGIIGVLTASTLRFRCRINLAAYIPPTPSLRLYPLVIAAHPSEPNQFALGITDGSIYVLEPLESEGKWGTSPPVRRKRNQFRSAPKVVRAMSPLVEL